MQEVEGLAASPIGICSTVAMQLLEWWPFTIVKGGRPANLLASSLDSEWGKKLFGKALIRSIAQPLWKVHPS